MTTTRIRHRARLFISLGTITAIIVGLVVFTSLVVATIIASIILLAAVGMVVSFVGLIEDLTGQPFRFRRSPRVVDDNDERVPTDVQELSRRYGQMGQRMRRSLQLRDDESAILELIAADTERAVVLRTICELLAKQFPGCRFRFATADVGTSDQADRTWEVVDATDQDPAWVLQAVLDRPSENPDADVIALARDLAQLALDKARDRSSLHYQANHDVLTGLLSRRAVLAELDRAIAADDAVGLIYGDVDHFKTINDRLGHLAGDDMLQEIARRLVGASTESGLQVAAGRLGGDEYLCVLSGCAEHEMTKFAERLEFSMRAPFLVGAVTTPASMSWGATFRVDGSTESGELLREADVALYQVKRNGRNSFRMFDDELREWTAERNRLEDDLAISITKRSGVHADFQPQFDVDRKLVGFEALGRWYRQGIGIVPPDEFIPVAVERGLMADFDHEMYSHVSQVLGAVRKEGRSFGTVSINVSAERLERADFVEATLAALRKAAIDPNDIVVEITESSLLRDLAERGRRLEELRRWGIRIAIDDFGTGYSSLSYLRELPVDIVKLDKEFVSDIDSSEESRAIVQAILALAKALKLEVVAEGVERESQFEQLAALGCDTFQGFLLGRPLTLDVAKECAQEMWPIDPFTTGHNWTAKPPDDAAELVAEHPSLS